MNASRILHLALASLVLAAAPASAQVQATKLQLPNVTIKAAEEINLWPGIAPGETGNIGPEHILPNRPRPMDQITNVSVPTLAVFHPPADKRTGTGVLVIPGGGLDRLAIETEGYEVAEWLNAHGMTAFVLKYRVPARAGGPRYKVGLQDAERAMGLIRARAEQWKVDPEAIGSIGFSAGAEINVMLSTYHADPRQYPVVDDADKLSTRPNFNIAIYGGGFAGPQSLREDINSRLNKNTPPMFIAHAFDDAMQTSLTLMAAMRRVGVPSEVHIFAAGAHGFGVRDSGLPVGQWRDQLLSWLAWQGYLDKPEVRSFAKTYVAARDGTAASLPRFSATRGLTLPQAFAAQKRIYRVALAAGEQVAGYKAAATSAAAQSSLGVKHPLHGVLFKSGRIDAKPDTVVKVDAKRPIVVETEIGYVIATDIGTKLRVPRQAVTTVEAIVPVIELPHDLKSLLGTAPNGLDAVAANAGSNRFIVGASVAPDTVGPTDALAVTLSRDGKQLHAITGADVVGGQAQNLMNLINQIVDQGHVLHRGDIIVSGALGGAKPGEKGVYKADFGKLGTIEFKIE